MRTMVVGLLAVMAAGVSVGAAAVKVKLTGEQHTKMLTEFRAYAGANMFG